MSKRTCKLNLATFLLCLAFALAAVAGEPARTVVVGDVHGDLDSLTLILREAGVIDAGNNWVAENTMLIQTGDMLDRGTQGQGVMDLLMKLERQADGKRSKVVVLLGNHEVMNIVGDLRYVVPEDYARYAGKDAQKQVEKAYRQYLDFRKKRAQALQKPVPVVTTEFEEEWKEAHPRGFFEHREAFGPKGKYGRWLRSKSAVIRVNETAFVHGGIGPALTGMKIEEINKRISEELQAYDRYKQYLQDRKIILPFYTWEEIVEAVKEELNAAEKEGKDSKHVAALEGFLGSANWLSMHPDGPLWFRGFARWSDEEGAEIVSNLVNAFGVNHFVSGHSPQLEGAIGMRFDGRVFLIDTGILRGYAPKGRPSALEIQDGVFTAIYENERVKLLAP